MMYGSSRRSDVYRSAWVLQVTQVLVVGAIAVALVVVG
jgi:hypothetical protein